MMKTLISRISIALVSLFVISNWTFGNNLEITNVTYSSTNNTLSFNVSWDNAFNINDDWNDHIYIFAKYKNANSGSWERVMFEIFGHSEFSTTAIFSVAYNSILEDGKRFAMKLGHESTFTSGTQSAYCTAALADNIDFFHPSFKVFGIEMVTISTIGNDYYVGDGISENRWHKGDDTTQAFFWEEDPFGTANIGNGPDDINTTHTDGIPVASIGEHIFRPTNNIMKYEISQIQYVEFLNTLNRTAQNNRVATDISGTDITNVYVFTETEIFSSLSRNGVRCDAILPNGGPITFYCDYNGNGVPNEYDDGQNIAMNYLSGADLFAYLDWAGMEPLNEMEYEQICRGSLNPVPGEFAWGTSGFTEATINSGSTNASEDESINGAPIMGPMRSSDFPMRCGAAATATTNRVTSGASAYGIMELTGNVAEIVIALRTSDSFTTVVKAPDGNLDMFGDTDEPWPQEVTRKGGYINSTTNPVSARTNNNSYPFTTRNQYHGGRGGY